MAFSPNGEFLLIEDYPRRRIHVWHLTGAAPTRILDEPADKSGQFSPDSRQVAVQQPDGVISVFELATKTRVQTLSSVPLRSRFAFHPDGSQLAATGSGGTQIRELASGKIVWQNKWAGEWVQWHPDGKTLAVCNSTAINLWDVAAGKLVGKLEGLTGGGVFFTINPAGDVLVSHGWSGLLRLWNPQTGQQVFSVPDNSTGLRFSPDGRFLAATENHNRLSILEIAAGREYRSLTANQLKGDRGFFSLAMSDDGRLVAVGGRAGAIGVWDVRSGKELAILAGAPGYNHAGFVPRPTPNNAGKIEETLLITSANGFFRRSIHFEPQTGNVEVGTAEKLPIPGKHYFFALSRDGKVLATPQGDGAVVWNPDQPGKSLHLGSQNDVRATAVSPDGQWVLTGRFSHPAGIKIWQARNDKFEFVADLPAHHTWAAFSPDGKRILTNGVTEAVRVIRRWEVGSWTELPFAEPLEGSSPAFSPDGKLIVLETGSGVTRLLDAETGKECARLEDPSQDRAVQYAFTPDGTRLLCATGDSSCVHVWDLQAIRRQLAEMKLDW